MTGREVALLVTVCGAQFLEVLGVTVIIVALPLIAADLDLAGGQLQLAISLYAVLYGALLLTAGRVADVIGRRRLLLAGLVVSFTGALVCAVAATGVVLLVGRAVQGLGGAMVTPAALALVTTAFPTGGQRRTAISAWTAAAAGGGALGFGAGGLLVEAAGWRAVFWLLAVVAVLLTLAAARLVPAETPGRRRGRGLDPVGTLTVVAGLLLLVIGAGQLENADASTATALVMLAAAGVLLAVFVATQRFGRDPLLGWAAITNRSFMIACAVALVNTATTSASGTLVALVAADVLGLRPAVTGLVLLPFSIMVVIGAGAGRWWLARPRWAGMATGLGIVAVAMAALAAATATTSVAGLTVAVAVAGLGLAWAALASTDAATAALSGNQQGTAAGGVNTAAQVGTALGVAVLLTLATAVDTTASGGRGYAAAFLAAAVTAGAVALALAVRRPRFTMAS